MEVEQCALQPLAVDAFPFFTTGERTVHTDGHVEIAGAFYPVPLARDVQRAVKLRVNVPAMQSAHSRTPISLRIRVELPSVEATGRWRERGRMQRR